MRGERSISLMRAVLHSTGVKPSTLIFLSPRRFPFVQVDTYIYRYRERAVTNPFVPVQYLKRYERENELSMVL